MNYAKSSIVKKVAVILCLFGVIFISCGKKEGHVVISISHKIGPSGYRDGILGMKNRLVTPIRIFRVFEYILQDKFHVYPISDETFQKIRTQIPSKYIWLHIEVYNPVSFNQHIEVKSPGWKTSWTNISFEINSEIIRDKKQQKKKAKRLKKAFKEFQLINMVNDSIPNTLPNNHYEQFENIRDVNKLEL